MLQYDIELSENVEDILSQDLWVSDQLSGNLLASIKDPIKFTSYTSVFVKKGACKCELNLIKYHLKAPCILSIKGNQILQKEYVSDDFEASFMVMSKRMVDSMFTYINSTSTFSFVNSTPFIQLRQEDVEVLNSFYDDIRGLLKKDKAVYGYQSLIFTFVAFFYRNVCNLFDGKLLESISQGRISDQFISLVQKNFRTERFLDFYANKMAITSKHLSRTVKQQTGSTAVEWIERYVILEAKVMLRSSNMTIQQIADELHFPSQSFFGKYFKKKVGVSPKEYRNTRGTNPITE